MREITTNRMMPTSNDAESLPQGPETTLESRANVKRRDKLDPRLGWFAAFEAVARHLSYHDASQELGQSYDATKRQVDDLQAWLHKLLLMVGPMELSPDGESFRQIANEIIAFVGALAPDPPDELVRPEWYDIRLSELCTLQVLVEQRNYKRAAYTLDQPEGQVRDDIKKLERIFGPLLSGRTLLTPNWLGTDVAHLSARILEITFGNVAPVTQADLNLLAMKPFERLATHRLALLRVALKRAEAEQEPKARRLLIEAAKDDLARWEGSIDAVRDWQASVGITESEPRGDRDPNSDAEA